MQGVPSARERSSPLSRLPGLVVAGLLGMCSQSSDCSWGTQIETLLWQFRLESTLRWHPSAPCQKKNLQQSCLSMIQLLYFDHASWLCMLKCTFFLSTLVLSGFARMMNVYLYLPQPILSHYSYLIHSTIIHSVKGRESTHEHCNLPASQTGFR